MCYDCQFPPAGNQLQEANSTLEHEHQLDGASYQQQGASQQHGSTRLPLQNGRGMDTQSDDDAQSADPDSVQQGASLGPTGQPDKSIGASNVVDSADTAIEPSSPASYPHTRLYQFADIELAHGH